MLLNILLYRCATLSGARWCGRTGRPPIVEALWSFQLFKCLNEMHSETADFAPVLPYDGELSETYVSSMILAYLDHYEKTTSSTKPEVPTYRIDVIE